MAKIKNKKDENDFCTEYDMFFKDLHKSYTDLMTVSPTTASNEKEVSSPFKFRFFYYKEEGSEDNTSSYRPLPKCITIKKSKIHGLGVFATENIYKRNFIANPIANSHFKVEIDDEDVRLLRLEVGGFINHSNTPNLIIKSTLTPLPFDHYQNWEYFGIFPIRDIKAGEELTVDYTKELCGLSGYDGAEFLKK